MFIAAERATRRAKGGDAGAGGAGARGGTGSPKRAERDPARRANGRLQKRSPQKKGSNKLIAICSHVLG
jgi:hypothetical protein